MASFTIDRIRIEDKEYLRWGGPAFYAALPSYLFCWKVEIYGICGQNFPWEFPKVCGKLIQTEDIIFEHTYKDSMRYSKIVSYPKPVYIEIPRTYSIGLISPVFNEFKIEAVKYALRRAELIGIDVQGFLRKERDGAVILEKNTNVLEVLRKANVVKMDLVEFRILGEFPGEINLITLAEKGAIAKVGKKFVYIPTYYIRGDPTGTGDVFFSAFLIKFFETRDIAKSLALANAVASLLVEGYIFSRSEKNIDEVFEKVKRKRKKILQIVETRANILLERKVVFNSFEQAIRNAYVFEG